LIFISISLGIGLILWEGGKIVDSIVKIATIAGGAAPLNVMIKIKIIRIINNYYWSLMF
jgi:hypothetical protein